jgi:hypothetical protein
VVFNIFEAGRRFIMQNDILFGVLQGNDLQYRRKMFLDKPGTKFFELLPALTNEEMWHYEILGGFFTRQKQFLTPCLLTKKDKKSELKALTLLLTPCLKIQVLLYSLGNNIILQLLNLVFITFHFNNYI